MNKIELEVFIGKYGRDIYSFCCYLTRSKQEADDLYQDSFVQILEKQGLPEDEEGAKNLALSTAVRLWKDKKRKFTRRRRIEEEKYIPMTLADDEWKTSAETPEAEMLKDEQNEYIKKCVVALPEKLKLVVLLYYMENRKMNEIADVLHIPIGTVKSRLHRAKAILSDELKEYYEKEDRVL
ncbi:MAG: sigma-70 family RNA polymerase sigma factor [Lachnospiraceae bacterium]|nr:sigma-70 family RNA polymerase sigma factor [Lachnospiraceae bacterium]